MNDRSAPPRCPHRLQTSLTRSFLILHATAVQPERAKHESEAGTGSQPVESIQEQLAPSLDPVAENASVETQFGAPVVRELSPDPGPLERLMTVRGVADRLGVCPALVYRLCQRGELSSLRIGGSLRFQLETVDGYLARLVTAHRNDRLQSPPAKERTRPRTGKLPTEP